MKFLNIYCETRKAEVFVNLDKIVLIAKTDEENTSLIRLAGEEAVKVALPAEELIRKINGEDRTGVGFRRNSL
ncbi:MAG TPA: hypothetical protein VM884_03825 [Flavisolibacter sp.]|jgi:hypothetical protein|nr:hypothetical protein [Flavisolibacter sp.]